MDCVVVTSQNLSPFRCSTQLLIHRDEVDPPDLSLIPTEYHELFLVFCKSKALFLPCHRPYDYAIDLMPSAPLPSTQLFNISLPERKAMETYKRDSLAAGIIRHSSSLLEVRFFFIGKKDGSLCPCIDY